MVVLVPRLGERAAELAETPLMLAVSVLAARLVVRRAGLVGRAPRVAVGGIALALLLAAELGVVHFVRGQSVSEYVASRDPLAGSVYLLAMAVFALAPLAFRAREESP